jgi:hypothetical protein
LTKVGVCCPRRHQPCIGEQQTERIRASKIVGLGAFIVEKLRRYGDERCLVMTGIYSIENGEPCADIHEPLAVNRRLTIRDCTGPLEHLTKQARYHHRDGHDDLRGSIDYAIGEQARCRKLRVISGRAPQDTGATFTSVMLLLFLQCMTSLAIFMCIVYK